MLEFIKIQEQKLYSGNDFCGRNVRSDYHVGSGMQGVPVVPRIFAQLTIKVIVFMGFRERLPNNSVISLSFSVFCVV